MADSVNSSAQMTPPVFSKGHRGTEHSLSAAQADADKSRMIAQQAQQGEHDANAQRAVMRAQLSEQLNKVLQTRDSARGLIR